MKILGWLSWQNCYGVPIDDFNIGLRDVNLNIIIFFRVVNSLHSRAGSNICDNICPGRYAGEDRMCTLNRSTL
jgi:hypothetical protein